MFKDYKKTSMSLNQMLRDTQLVLRNLKQTLQQGFGYSVFDNEQIIDKYSKFVKKWKEIGKPELYFLALDIKKCYDSINAQKLLELFLQTDLLDYSYLINKYLLLARNKKSFAKNDSATLPQYFNLRERVYAVSLRDKQKMRQGFNEKLKDSRPAIIINMANCKLITKNEMNAMIQHVCSENFIQFENRYFQQKYGIPQGLNISSVLCSFYFSHLEMECTKFLREQEDSNSIYLLMRLTDDYIFITNRRENSIQLIDNLYQCSKLNKF